MRQLLTAMIAWLALSGSAFAGHITYSLVSLLLIDFDDGAEYSLTGRITTNGALGNLTPSDIVDYKIYVRGTTSFTFTPDNPGAEVNIEGDVPATSSQLFADGRLQFVADANLLPECTNCTTSIEWTVNPPPGSEPAAFYNIVQHNGGVAEPLLTLSTRRPAVVARIPEPASLALTPFFGATAAFARRRGRRRAAQPNSVRCSLWLKQAE